MAGNSFGSAFVVSTFGESHGAAVGCVIDGCPPRLPLAVADIQPALDRRKPGQSKYVTQRRESDTVEILSGVFEGQTTGTPIAMLIRNTDAKSKDYAAIKDKFRPGHADFSYFAKYGIRDHRGGGRSSARETAARVAAGAVANIALKSLFKKINIRAHLSHLGEIPVPYKNARSIDDNPFFAATNDAALIKKLQQHIDMLRREGDSCGAEITIAASGIPAGLGEPVFDRLDADIAKAMMSINAVKGVEIGSGFAAARARGSENNDEMDDKKFLSNNAGGILGGISTGADIVARIAIKPTSSIVKTQQTRTTRGGNTTITTHGRHDPCVGIRAVPIAEAMMALTLADHALRQRGQCGGVVKK